MYIKKRLLKSINETYYRKYQDTDMVSLTLGTHDKSHWTEYVQNSVIAKDLGDIELYNQIVDLSRLLDGRTDEYTSDLGQKLQFDIALASHGVNSYVKRLPTVFEEVSEILKELSDQSCIVGGFVRDTLLNSADSVTKAYHTPTNSTDVDYVTDVSYDRLKEVFEGKGFSVKTKGEAYLVLMVSKDSTMIEISNFRKDAESADGRHPDYVEIGTITEDANRRDFFANSLYFNLTTETVIDPTGQGLIDIQNKELNFVGKPKERIKEDFLRVWRAFRLSKTKGLTLGRKTEKALREMFNEAYENSNPARVLQEMIKLGR